MTNDGFIYGEIEGKTVKIPFLINQPSGDVVLQPEHAIPASSLHKVDMECYTMFFYIDSIADGKIFYIGQLMEKDICVQGETKEEVLRRMKGTIQAEKEGGVFESLEPAPDKFFKELFLSKDPSSRVSIYA